MAVQDIKLRIQAGQTVTVQKPGDFIYLKFSDRQISVIESQSRFEMEAGDKYVAERPFKDFQVENLDQDNPAYLIFAVGEGDYHRQIVQGQLTTTIGIKTATGEFIGDTRQRITLDVIPVDGTGLTENYMEVVKTLMPNGQTDWRKIRHPNGDESYYPYDLSYNPNLHDYPLVRAPAFGVARHHVFSWNPATQRVVRYFGLYETTDSASGYTRFGNTEYQCRNSGIKGVYRRVSGGVWELYYQFQTEGATAVHAFKDGGLLVLHGNNAFSLLDSLGQLEKTEYLTGIFITGGVIIDRQENVTLLAGSGVPRVYTRQMVQIGTLEATTAVAGAACGFGAYLIDTGVATSGQVRVRALETVVDLLAGKASEVCQNAWLGPKPALFDAVRTSANIDVSDADTANPTVTGELVKMILEWYLGHPVDDLLYMDYLHGISITGSTNTAGDKLPTISIESNGQTLLAAKIPDQFAAILPFTATITTDSRINQ